MSEIIPRSTLNAAKVSIRFSMNEIGKNTRELKRTCGKISDKVDVLRAAIDVPNITSRLKEFRSIVGEIDSSVNRLTSLTYTNNPAAEIEYTIHTETKRYSSGGMIK